MVGIKLLFRQPIRQIHVFQWSAHSSQQICISAPHSSLRIAAAPMIAQSFTEPIAQTKFAKFGLSDWLIETTLFFDLKMIGKGFYSKWVKSSFEQFITTQTRVGSTNGWIISQNTETESFIFRQFPEIFAICDVISRLRLRWMCP